MARTANKLTVRQVETMTKPGKYADGNGLYLQIAAGGSKSWLVRYMRDGKARAMGLGPVAVVPLAMAREKALEAQRTIREGMDPIEARQAQKQERALAEAKAITFRKAAEQYIAAHRSGWKNAKHAAQWTSTLETYAYPVIGNLSIAAIDTGLVLKIVEPIWQSKTETATRVRSRIENILDWATVRGYRQGDNPARWRGHLEKSLPARSKVRKVKHHAALPYQEIAAFMVDLRAREAVAARALEFAILTAARSGEVLNASWSEFDLDEGVWTIPADRMKAGTEHHVPLSARAVQIIKQMGEDFGKEGFVFPGQKPERPLSGMAFAMILRRMNRADITAHGFRSTFRDWVAEQTAYAHDVAEMALAHTVANKVEAAYRRGNMFDKRKRLMTDWADYCAIPKADATVIAIRG
ncbi:site-specific integrase [Minwuia sp. IMCC3060]|uniref:tyrosine-type recombinase/integrase n=1 Tax=Minwuia sp. IMCC3060 TaxID=3040675 RepID=UPI002478517A|nr:site-specific integrase [Minwuia sp. IMCC3060]